MYKNIVVPLDGSELSEKALAHAKDIGGGNATIHVVRVFTANPERGNITPSPTELGQSTSDTAEMARNLAEAQLADVENYLAAIVNQLTGEGINAQSEILHGSADDRIVNYAKQNNVDVIVMSTRGRGGVSRMLLGSITDRVIRAGEVPVLVIPS